MTDGSLAKITTGLLRGPKQGAYERLVTVYLLKAARTNEPLVKISAICDAARLSKRMEHLDMDMVDITAAVALSFTRTRLRAHEPVDIAWVFPETVTYWKQYINCWQHIGLTYHPLNTPYRQQYHPVHYQYMGRMFPTQQLEYDNQELEARRTLHQTVVREVNALPLWEQFFVRTSALAVDSFDRLRGEFETWALPILVPMQGIIAEGITPDVFMDMFRTDPGDDVKGGADP